MLAISSRRALARALAPPTATTATATTATTATVAVTLGAPSTQSRQLVSYTPAGLYARPTGGSAESVGAAFVDLDTPPESAPVAGRAWTVSELRQKSFEDLHTLWFVLLKERNILNTEAARAKSTGLAAVNPARRAKVRKSMARIKLVLGERAKAEGVAMRTWMLQQKAFYFARQALAQPNTYASKPKRFGKRKGKAVVFGLDSSSGSGSGSSSAPEVATTA